MKLKVIKNIIWLCENHARHEESEEVFSQNKKFFNEIGALIDDRDTNKIIIQLNHTGFYFGRESQIKPLNRPHGISGKHFKIEKHTLGHWFIEDLDSLNGTFIVRNSRVGRTKYQLIPKVEYILNTGDFIGINDGNGFLVLFEVE